MTLDFVSKRYGVLPSEMLARGTSLDVHCAEIAIGYEHYLNDKQSAKLEGRAPSPAKYSTEQLQSMIDAVKGKKVDS